MHESPRSLDRLRAACGQQARPAHVYRDLAQCLARSLEARIVLLSICGRSRYCHRGPQESTRAELAAAIRIADAFLTGDAAPNTVAAGSALMNSFAGMRIRAAGHTIGTLCLFDRRPGAIDEALLDDMLRLTEAVVASVHARTADVQRQGDIHA